MKAYSNKTRVRGAALLALHELRRTDRTGFRVDLREEQPTLIMARNHNLTDKVKMAALLAIDELQKQFNTRYSLEKGKARDEIVIAAGPKLGPMVIMDKEKKMFRKFGLVFKTGIRNSDGRLLYFFACDALDLIRA